MRLDPRSGPSSTARRIGVVGFLFFFLKGVLWLALPAWLYITR